jgi:hypothetical protein
MKSQKYGLALILILGVSLLSFSVRGSQESQVTPDQARFQALLDQMKGSTDVPEKAKESLAQQISDDFGAMKALFEAKDFCYLAKLLGKRGASLVTPGFEKIWGAESAEYWQSVWKDGAELKLVPVHVYVSSVKEPQLVPFCAVIDQGIKIEEWKKNRSYYDAVAILVFECRIVKREQGKISHNITGEAAAIYIHQTGCPWG